MPHTVHELDFWVSMRTTNEGYLIWLTKNHGEQYTPYEAPLQHRVWALQNQWLSNLANKCSNTHRFLFRTVLALIATCTTPILSMRSPFLLCYRLRSNQLRPQVQLRPAPLCRGRLMHIHNKTLSLYAEANGLCNRFSWLCLLLSCSKDAQ